MNAPWSRSTLFLILFAGAGYFIGQWYWGDHHPTLATRALNYMAGLEGAVIGLGVYALLAGIIKVVRDRS